MALSRNLNKLTSGVPQGGIQSPTLFIRLRNMFVAFLSKIFILTKTKSYGYKLINYVFSVAVYDLLPLLDQFVDAVPPKIPGSGIEEFVEPVFKVLIIVEGSTHHMIRKRAEKIVIRGCKVQRIWWMLKDLPFKLLECGFDDLCKMRPGIVMMKYGLALSMGSFQLNSLIHMM